MAKPLYPRRKAQAGPRAVVIHSLADATAALAAARGAGVPVALWSAEAAAASAGAGWFKAVTALAAAAEPEVPFVAVLDCGDYAGYAMGALRIGIRAICFRGPARMAAKLADIAGQEGALFLRRRPRRALDLRGAENPLALCSAWLAAAPRR